MMNRFGGKRLARFLNISTGMLLLFGSVALSLNQSGLTGSMSVAEAAANSSIGVVDFQRLVTSAPNIDNVRTTMKNEVAAAEKDFANKAQSMSEQEKQNFGKQLQTRLMNRENELMTPVLNSINAAIKAVANKKGLSVVVHKNVVVLGGVDITEEVVKAMK